jgi:ParB/RepB/Spo0J family partition protein
LTTKNIQNISLKQLQPNKWNPNVMQETEFKALKKDLENSGPTEIDALLISPFLAFYPCEDTEENRKLYVENQMYVIVDGEHRWNAAIELNWSDIPCEIRELSEEEAKGICYRKNKDRGTIDPFKEAALFKTELDLLSQKEIAEKYLVDPSTVSHRLSLLKLVPEVKKQIEQLPRGTITISHLEPIATLPEGEQKKIKLKNEWGHQEVKSVRDLTEEAKRIKEGIAEKEALQKALKTAKFPKCPKCNQEPGSIDHRKLPWVDCSSGYWNHIWNMDTGKGPYEEEKVERKKINGEKSESIKKTSVLRSAHTIDELSKCFAERLKEMIPKLQKISSFSIKGKLEDNKDLTTNFSGYGDTMQVSIHLDDGFFWFNAEKKAYRTGEKSKVNARSPDYVERTKLFIENAFQGKLEIPCEEQIKNSKPKDTLVAGESEIQAEANLEIPCFDCANDHENGGNCHRERFIVQDVGGYTCKFKVQLSGEELAKIASDAEISQALGQ